MARFIALPVGQGDSFYIQTRGLSILVDGGRSRHNLSRILVRHAAPQHLDIVVCTHNDADHVEGLVGLLEELPCSVREVWLPASWAYRFHDLAEDPILFYGELDGELHSAKEDSLSDVYQSPIKGFLIVLPNHWTLRKCQRKAKARQSGFCQIQNGNRRFGHEN